MVCNANAAYLALNSNDHLFIYSFFQQISTDIYTVAGIQVKETNMTFDQLGLQSIG